jgi:tetrahydromethanopterin S-methyltransferase subunit G
MKTLIEKLVQIMTRLVDEHRGLLSDSEAHQRALVKGDTANIGSKADAISKRVERIYQIEQQRQKITQDIGHLLGVPEEQVNISFLMQHVEPQEKLRIEQHSAKLEKVIVELVRVNDQNRNLVEQSMRYLHKTVELVAGSVNQEGYGNGTKPAAGGHLFNVQA